MVHRTVNATDAQPLNAARMHAATDWALGCESPAFAAIAIMTAA
jgi:hypothetical protein